MRPLSNLQAIVARKPVEIDSNLRIGAQNADVSLLLDAKVVLFSFVADVSTLDLLTLKAAVGCYF
ncbi:hypothetical protein J6590_028857 [Homalodisca vitripennis]|nr:hypothetical protein J6590_028857 [Homalodisca vitripennis]